MKSFESLLNTIIVESAATSIYPKMYFYQRLVHAKLYIDLHFAENIDLTAIAEEACYSRYHFMRKFKEVYHKTPHQYVNEVRIEHAKRLFKQGCAVTEVSSLLGFEEVSSFSRFFKQKVGLSPKVYLQKERIRQVQAAEQPQQVVPSCFAYQYRCFAENEQF